MLLCHQVTRLGPGLNQGSRDTEKKTKKPNGRSKQVPVNTQQIEPGSKCAQSTNVMVQKHKPINRQLSESSGNTDVSRENHLQWMFSAAYSTWPSTFF